MTLALPDYEQVVLQGSPLEEVVCQLRFPQILKISASPPAEFQELVRKQLPTLEQERGIQIGMAGGEPILAATNEPAWQFGSTDQQWTATLTSQFIALKTTAYTEFEDFLSRLLSIVEPFERIYEPPYYARVGLRYVNRLVIEREDDRRVEWERLLNSHLAGIYADPVLRDGIAASNHQLVLKTEYGQIGWRHSMDVGLTEGVPAERFTLDFDHYNDGQVACQSIRQLLLGFNDAVYRLFRWCLTDEGYRKLDPKPKRIKK